MRLPSKEPVHVTDHAVLRYLERVIGLNIDVVRDHIAGICAAPAAFGVSAVRAEGVRFEITNNTVITVRPDSTMATATKQRRMVLSVGGSR